MPNRHLGVSHDFVQLLFIKKHFCNQVVSSKNVFRRLPWVSSVHVLLLFTKETFTCFIWVGTSGKVCLMSCVGCFLGGYSVQALWHSLMCRLTRTSDLQDKRRLRYSENLVLVRHFAISISLTTERAADDVQQLQPCPGWPRDTCNEPKAGIR
jgi:hypothetical protein